MSITQTWPKVRRSASACPMALPSRALTVLLVFCGILLIAPRWARAGENELAEGFQQPPASCRPWVYWFWMDGNSSKEGITADLEAMSKAGIGGALLMEVDVGIPRGPVKFMSEPWQALFKHAVLEAERLKLEITLNVGPGWTGSGGPWVKPEQSMQHIVASTTQVAGPTDAEIDLPRPAPRAPHWVHAPLPPEVETAWKEFYQDVAIVAFPTPGGEFKIADVDEKALYYRDPYSSAPGVKPFLPAPAEFGDIPAGVGVPRASIVDLSDRLGPDGKLRWSVPAGNWTFMRFGRTITGANTRPSPAPGIGLECDKFDKAALDAHFEAFVGPLMREIGPRSADRTVGWTMLHLDSWEMASQNWTGAFRDEFRRRRGYDLLPYLPAVTGQVVESLETSERFLWDLRQTVNELIVENHAGRLKELAHHRGFKLSIEPYDLTPCADLDLGGVADVPMCEFWSQGYGFETSFSCFEAVSAAHTCGRTIVGAEAFTANDTEAWRLYPGKMKPQADWAFCCGINRLVFHRYAHQPWLDRWPGMTMGPYGVHYERTQTWWDMAGGWHDYIARCQFMLRRGLPVADICYLVAEGAPHVFRAPPSALQGTPPVQDRRGYNFDGCSPMMLEKMAVNDTRVQLPSGASYRVLVLPEMQTMTPASLERIKQLVMAGAVVVGPRPLKSPSLSGYPQCDAEVQRLAAELWGNPAATEPAGERIIGQGKVIASRGGAVYPVQYGEYEQVAEVLGRMGVPPDFEANAPLRYVHRRDSEADIYFVAHAGDDRLDALCTFRVAGKVPQIWDPLNGHVHSVSSYEEIEGRSRLALSFEPRQSLFIVFQRTAPVTVVKNKLPPSTQPATELAGPWNVRFQPGRGAPQQLTFEKLLDWSTHPDATVRHFSGTASYTTNLRIAEDWLAPGRQLELNLGRVEVMARVILNDKDLGVYWTPPFTADITGAAKPGDNKLEIQVANLWPNRLIADQALPENERVTWTTWNPYKSDHPLFESGLIGPVNIRSLP